MSNKKKKKQKIKKTKYRSINEKDTFKVIYKCGCVKPGIYGSLKEATYAAINYCKEHEKLVKLADNLIRIDKKYNKKEKFQNDK